MNKFHVDLLILEAFAPEEEEYDKEAATKMTINKRDAKKWIKKDYLTKI